MLNHIRFFFFVGEASQKISGRVKDMDDKVGLEGVQAHKGITLKYTVVPVKSTFLIDHEHIILCVYFGAACGWEKWHFA